MESFITGADRERIQSLLVPEERLLWCDKPLPTGLVGRTRLYFYQCCGLFGGLTLIYIMTMCYVGSPAPVGNIIFILLLLPELLIGIVLPILKYRQMRCWLYAITNRRALAVLHDDVREWPLVSGMVKEYKPGTPGAIVFSYEKSFFHRNKPWLLEEGFLRCREAERALALLDHLLSGHARPEIAPPDAQARMAQVFHESQAIRLATTPGLLAALLLTLFLALGSLCSVPFWWHCIPLPLNALLLILTAIGILIVLATLRTYRRGLDIIRKRSILNKI